ncbi:MAG: response regulator, partial [Bacteroidales bacterium]|nr:response regulator [Bacteroidales bacterium]
IVNDLLDFSKIEAGSLMLDEIPFNVSSEIKYCINVANTIKRDDVEIIWSVDEKVPDSLIGDPFRLRQVITNLLFTSLEHTEKGKVVIKCMIEESGMGTLFLKFDIKDTGKGYDKTSLKKMFGEYIRAESKSILGYEGKGLTGVISKQLIEMMGGDFTPSTPSGISDDPETPGARFVFSVKVYSNERVHKSYGSDKITKYSKIKTLVISGGRQRDEELLNALHKFGLSTYVTGWQKQTVNLIKSNLGHEDERYKMVIILDVGDFDGFKVGKEIWENELYKEFMILLVSSNDQRGNYSRCIHYGIDDYLVKPFHLSELFDIIQNRFPNIESDLDPAMLEDLRKDLNILVVEDNLINQKVAITILKSLGYEVDMASNGEEGIKMAGDKNYDLIFMDLIMPVVDGFEAARTILQKDSKVKIVALTADSTIESVKKAELSGMERFISKPVKQEQVKKILINLFSDTVG